MLKNMKSGYRKISLVLVLVMVMMAAVSAVPSGRKAKAASKVDGSKIVALARSYEGKVPYVWGGTSLANGCDCSGFICRIYEKFGINLWANRTKLRNAGTNIGTDFSKAIPGDIVWFTGHVGIYAGMSGGYPMMVNEIGGNVCNVKYMRVSWCTAALRGIIRLPQISGEGDGTGVFGDVSFSSYSVGNITQTNAVPKCSISYSGNRPSEAGLYFGTSQANLRKVASDRINHNKNPFDAWYDLSSEAGVRLTAATQYYYQFYVVKDGQEFKSAINSFTTKPEAVNVSFYNYSISGVTTNNAVPRCSISYSGVKPSSVGIYVGTSTLNMKKVAGDVINHNKNPFDAWYNLRTEGGVTLKRNTVYYFRFYAVFNGVEYQSQTCYFVTKR